MKVGPYSLVRFANVLMLMLSKSISATPDTLEVLAYLGRRSDFLSMKQKKKERKA